MGHEGKNPYEDPDGGSIDTLETSDINSLGVVTDLPMSAPRTVNLKSARDHPQTEASCRSKRGQS